MEEKIIVLSDVLEKRPVREITAFVGGKDLALNPTQISSLSGNYQTKASSFQPVEPVMTEPLVTESISVPEPPVTVIENIGETPSEEVLVSSDPITPVEAPIISEIPVVPEPPAIEEPMISVVSDIEPVAVAEPNDLPNIENVVEPPVTGQVEIVSEAPVSSDYDVLTEKIKEVNEEYDSKIAELNQQRNNKIMALLEENKKKIVETESKIIDLKSRAEEHLKNAQAAEQIATIAHQNAQSVQNDMVLEKTA